MGLMPRWRRFVDSARYLWDELVRKPVSSVMRTGPSRKGTTSPPSPSKAEEAVPLQAPKARGRALQGGTGRETRCPEPEHLKEVFTLSHEGVFRYPQWLRAGLILVGAAFAVGYLAFASLERTQGTPRPIVHLIGGAAALILLWIISVEWIRKGALRMAAWYQQDIFDLKERGTPLYRAQEQVAGLKQLTAEVDLSEELSEELTLLEEEKEGQPYFRIAPLEISERFLQAKLSGHNLPWVTIRRTEPLNLHRPEVQVALWLGGPNVWHLDRHTVVVLEQPARPYFRVLRGPTIDSLPKEKSFFQVPWEKDRREALLKHIRPEFISRDFERLRRVFILQPYVVAVGPLALRTRDGILIEMPRCEIRATFGYGSARALRELCVLLLQERGREGLSWDQEWLDALDGQGFLRKALKAFLTGAVRTFVQSHTLEQLLYDFQAPEETLMSIQERLRKQGEEPPLSPASLEDFRRLLEDRLRRVGFRLEDVRVPPTWRLPKTLRQAQKGWLQQFRTLKRREQQLEEDLVHYYRGFLGECLRPMVSLADQVSEDEVPFLETARKLLSRLQHQLGEGLFLWQDWEARWYEDAQARPSPLKAPPPFEQREVFQRKSQFLRNFWSWSHTVFHRPPAV